MYVFVPEAGSDGRRTAAKRMRAELQTIKQELRRNLHEPVGAVGAWLKRVVEGYHRYHAVPGNREALGRSRQAGAMAG